MSDVEDDYLKNPIEIQEIELEEDLHGKSPMLVGSDQLMSVSEVDPMLLMDAFMPTGG